MMTTHNFWPIFFYCLLIIFCVPKFAYSSDSGLISAGYFHTCALYGDNSVVCWGNDSKGQSTPPSGQFSQVSAGYEHTCGIRDNGMVACWGDNAIGQSTPPSEQFSQISAGIYHTCGIKSDKSIACWGGNSDGQSTPPDGQFNHISAGYKHTCAVKSDGIVTCWGNNDKGQITPPNGQFNQVSAWYKHSCAIKSDSTVVCWGDNDNGQGDPPSGTTFSQVTAGDFHTCGIKNDGKVACWGYNDFGQSDPPPGQFIQISAGSKNMCGIKSDGVAICWGDNGEGRSSPPSEQFNQMSAGAHHVCGIKSNNKVSCWGWDDNGQSTPPLAQFSQISAGGYYTCGIKISDNTVVCWGDNSKGQSDAPVDQFIQIDAGYAHICGIKTDKTVACWGNQSNPPSDQFDQISAGGSHTCGIKKNDNTVVCWGDNSKGQSNAPNGQFIQISAGGNPDKNSTCGIKTDNTLVCWGDEKTPPQGKFIQISTNGANTCGIKMDNTVACWGGGSQSNPPPNLLSEISLGDYFSCGIRKSSSDIVCWGTTTPPPTNQPPVQTIPTSAQVVSVDEPLTFSTATNNAITITDDERPNDLDQLLRVTLTTTDGTLTLANQTGLNFLSGDGNDDVEMTFTGTIDQINTALDGLTFVPLSTVGDTASLEITTNDQGHPYAPSFGLIDTDTIAIAVTRTGNYPPRFTAADPPIVDENSGAQVVSTWVTDFYAGADTEADQVALAYTVSHISNPALFLEPLKVDTDGTLSYTLAPDIYGETTFQVVVQDDGGTDNGGIDTSAPQKFTLVVNPVFDTLPVLAPIGNQPVALGELLTFTATASGETEVTFSLKTDLIGASINPINGKFQWLAKEAGSFEVTIIVTDEHDLKAEEKITIVVGNTPPVLSPIEDKQVPLGDTLTFTVEATNTEKEVLSFSLREAPTNAVIDSKQGAFTWTPTQTGTFNFTVVVNDAGGLEDSVTLTVTVTTEPTLAPVGEKTTTVNSLLTFAVKATHPDNLPLTFSLSDSLEGTTIDAESGIFAWTPTEKGIFNVTFVVSDTYGESASETITVTVTAAPTHLDLVLASEAIFLNGTLGVSGQLNRYPPGDTGTLPIDLQITAFDGTTTTVTTTTDAEGTFVVSDLPAFNQTGTYYLQATFAGDSALMEATSGVHSVNVQALAGYALLIQGRVADGSGMDTYNKSLNRVYRILKARGFIDDNIDYLNYNPNQQGIVIDDIPSYATITTAFERLQAKLNTDPAPLYIVMVDHGNTNGDFHLDNGDGGILTPVDLNGWLNQLESNLSVTALAEPRIISIGACYSGSFIPTVSLPGRILITSATATEESYKGPKEPDEIRSGEFFIEAFFAQLGKGKALKTAFELATQSTEMLTRIDDEGFDPVYQDNAAQHPLLDDNGDKKGRNVLYTGQDDQWTETLFLGLGPRLYVTAPGAPAEILTVTPPVYLDTVTSSVELFATVNNPTRLLGGIVMVDIRSPSLSLPIDGLEQTEQLAVDNLERLFLHPDQGSRFVGSAGQFIEPGRYDILYFVQDALTGNVSPLKQSAVYKALAGNHAPLPFTLSFPENEAQTNTVVIFSWGETLDPDWDAITYTFTVATDPQFTQVVYQKTGLRTTVTYIDKETPVNDAFNPLGLRDGTEYFWQVEAVDSYGAQAVSETFTFTTNDTNAPPSIASFNVTSAIDFSDMDNVSIQIDGIAEDPVVHTDQGKHILFVPAGQHTATLSAPGFSPQSVEIGMSSTGNTIAQNILLTSPFSLPIRYGSLQFTVANNTVQEAMGTMNVLVNRTNGTNGAVSVQYTTAEGSAQADKDYIPANGTLHWAEGDELAKRITVTIIDDSYFENNESILLNLFEVTGGATLGMPAQTTLTIIDNDPETASPEPEGNTPPQPENPIFLPSPTTPSISPAKALLQFTQVSYDASEGIETVNITVTRENNLAGEVSIAYAVYPDTATEADYILTQGNLAWVDGDGAEKTFAITIVDDALVETTEKATLALTEVTGQAELGTRRQAVLIISDNDAEPAMPKSGTLQFSQTDYVIYENSEAVTIAIERIAGDEGQVSVDYSALAGTAQPEEDYLVEGGTLTWDDGVTATQTFKISLFSDEVHEGSEQLYLLLSNPTNEALLGMPNPVTLTIRDNLPDLPPLGNGTTFDSNGHLLETKSHFFGGISVSGNAYAVNATVTRFESVVISGAMAVDRDHIGEKADILIVGSYTADTPEATTQFYRLDSAGNILRWDQNMATLQPAQQERLLETQWVDIFTGYLIAEGTVQIYFGYQSADGTLVFNGQQTIKIAVQH